MGRLAFLFPGQASQSVGMDSYLREYPDAVDFLNRINEMTGVIGLSNIISNGPSEILTRTDNVQPAITMISISIMNVLVAAGVKPEGTAGHSLGEYAALVTAGVLLPGIAAKLTRIRGELMQQCANRHPGGMLALIGIELDKARKCVEEASSIGPVGIANVNATGQVVISGANDALEKAGELCKAAGARRVIPLKVSGAWHSPLMKDAAKGLECALDDAGFYEPEIPVVANVTAGLIRSGDEAKQLLKEQVTSPVLWADSMKKLLSSGFDTFIEVGPGQVLQGLLKRVENVTVYGTHDKEALDKTLSELA
ncbi:MAG: ACP S-malonyltransferase [Candidatus Fermentibacteraceae bacterium]|nr:ACP S-malonyltransferase [Candidatus Fermentibacteraceae bacterium]